MGSGAPESVQEPPQPATVRFIRLLFLWRGVWVDPELVHPCDPQLAHEDLQGSHQGHGEQEPYEP